MFCQNRAESCEETRIFGTKAAMLVNQNHNLANSANFPNDTLFKIWYWVLVSLLNFTCIGSKFYLPQWQVGKNLPLGSFSLRKSAHLKHPVCWSSEAHILSVHNVIHPKVHKDFFKIKILQLKYLSWANISGCLDFSLGPFQMCVLCTGRYQHLRKR